MPYRPRARPTLIPVARINIPTKSVTSAVSGKVINSNSKCSCCVRHYIAGNQLGAGLPLGTIETERPCHLVLIGDEDPCSAFSSTDRNPPEGFTSPVIRTTHAISFELARLLARRASQQTNKEPL